MAYTEIKNKNGRKYYYRVKSIRNGKKFKKQRIYLGKNLSKDELKEKMKRADKELKIDIKKKEDILDKIKPKIIQILKKNNIKQAGIFGSYARRDYKKNSDIDILIKPSKDMGFKFVGLEIELSKKLNRKVDLVSYDGISPHLKKDILSQEIKIL